VREFFREPLSPAELTRLVELAGGAAALFSWKSPSARALALDPATAAADRLLALMQSEPRLVRRPLVTRGEAIAVGSDPAGLARLFGEG
jgi:arsenate reductase-like glutaredoxin family protein